MSFAEFKVSLRKYRDNRKVTSLDIEHLGQINGLLSRLEDEKRFMKRLKMFGIEETEVVANAIKQYLLYGG